jgi:hypothetical protein
VSTYKHTERESTYNYRALYRERERKRESTYKHTERESTYKHRERDTKRSRRDCIQTQRAGDCIKYRAE